MGVGVVGPPSSTGELDVPRVCYNTLVKSYPQPTGCSSRSRVLASARVLTVSVGIAFERPNVLVRAEGWRLETGD